MAFRPPVLTSSVPSSFGHTSQSIDPAQAHSLERPLSPTRGGSLSGSSSLDDHVAVWYELRRHDPDNTGLVSSSSLRQAIEDAGLRIGSKEADRILVSVRFLNDGSVDYLRLGEVVDQMCRTMETATSHASTRKDPGFSINPHTTTDPVPLPDERMQQQAIRMKERVFALQGPISDAFRRFDKDEMTSEQFLKYLGSLGLQQTKAVIHEIRRRDEMGSCSFSRLMKALCLADDSAPPAEAMRATPVRSPLTTPGRNPLTHAPRPYSDATLAANSQAAHYSSSDPHDTNATYLDPQRQSSIAILHLPPSLRDSDVITWREDPKKGRPISKAMQNKVVVAEDVVQVPSRLQADISQGTISYDAAAMLHERIFALARDFIEGKCSGVEFRNVLRDMNLDINHDLERVIAGHERDASLRFQDFVKYLEIYLGGDVRFNYRFEDYPVTRPSFRLTHSDEDVAAFDRPPSPLRDLDSLPHYMRGSQDVLTWSKRGEDFGRPTAIKTYNNITSNSDDFALWETEGKLYPTASTIKLGHAGRPFTPKKHFDAHNSSRVDFEWPEDETAPNEVLAATGSATARPQSATGGRKSSMNEILNWTGPNGESSPKFPPRSPDKTHAIAPGIGMHPKAPYGTSRDVHYNINPHRPNGERGGKSMHYK